MNNLEGSKKRPQRKKRSRIEMCRVARVARGCLCGRAPALATLSCIGTNKTSALTCSLTCRAMPAEARDTCRGADMAPRVAIAAAPARALIELDWLHKVRLGSRVDPTSIFPFQAFLRTSAVAPDRCSQDMRDDPDSLVRERSGRWPIRSRPLQPVTAAGARRARCKSKRATPVES